MQAQLQTTTSDIEQLQDEIAQAQKTIRSAEAQIFRLTPKFTPEQEATIKATVKKLRQERYNTHNGLTIYKLRQAGCLVSVTHIRYTTIHTSKGTPVKMPIPTFNRGIYEFDARGGATHIVILKQATNKQYAVSSVCHEIDSFDYKMGVKEALDQFTQDEANELLA